MCSISQVKKFLFSPNYFGFAKMSITTRPKTFYTDLLTTPSVDPSYLAMSTAAPLYTTIAEDLRKETDRLFGTMADQISSIPFISNQISNNMISEKQISYNKITSNQTNSNQITSNKLNSNLINTAFYIKDKDFLKLDVGM